MEPVSIDWEGVARGFVKALAGSQISYAGLELHPDELLKQLATEHITPAGVALPKIDDVHRLARGVSVASATLDAAVKAYRERPTDQAAIGYMVAWKHLRSAVDRFVAASHTTIEIDSAVYLAQ